MCGIIGYIGNKHPKDVLLNGLKALRREQCNMFFGKDFEIRPIGKINTSGKISGTVTENGGNGWLP